VAIVTVLAEFVTEYPETPEMFRPEPLGAICVRNRSSAGKAKRIFGVKLPALSPVVTSTDVPLFTNPVTSVTVLHEVTVNANGPVLFCPPPFTSAWTV
jgi:hypothetical protein